MMSLNDFVLSLMTGSGFPRCEHSGFKEACYQHWQSFWTEIYSTQNSEFKPSFSDFYRQDFILALSHKSSPQIPIGLSCTSAYNIASDVNMNHHYLLFYDEDFRNHLLRKKIHQIMSSEYLSLNPEYRIKIGSIRVASLLIEATILFAKEIGFPHVVATARADNGTSHLCQELGYEVIQPALQKRAFKVDTLHVDAKLRSPPDELKFRALTTAAQKLLATATTTQDAELKKRFFLQISQAQGPIRKSA